MNNTSMQKILFGTIFSSVQLSYKIIQLQWYFINYSSYSAAWWPAGLLWSRV